MVRRPPSIRRGLAPASCTWASVLSRARILPRIPNRCWPMIHRGEYWVSACAAAARAMRWHRRTGCTAAPNAMAPANGCGDGSVDRRRGRCPRSAALEHLVGSGRAHRDADVTEKGYCRDAATGALDEDDAAIRRDLAIPVRRAACLACWRSHCTASRCGCCAVHRAELRQPSGERRHDASRGDAVCRVGSTRRWGTSWRNSVAFPDCMVDRIVPATTA